jgi:hypothetical protein
VIEGVSLAVGVLVDVTEWVNDLVEVDVAV